MSNPLRDARMTIKRNELLSIARAVEALGAAAVDALDEESGTSAENRRLRRMLCVAQADEADDRASLRALAKEAADLMGYAMYAYVDTGEKAVDIASRINAALAATQTPAAPDGDNHE